MYYNAVNEQAKEKKLRNQERFSIVKNKVNHKYGFLCDKNSLLYFKAKTKFPKS